MWTPKMHKSPPKQRFIAVSNCCTTKPLSSRITQCLKLVQQSHTNYCNTIESYTGYNFMWIINNSIEVHKHLDHPYRSLRNLATYDFSTLYTSIPHEKLKSQLKWVIEKAFNGKPKYIKIKNYTKIKNDKNNKNISWSNSFNSTDSFFTSKDLISSINFLIDNTYVTIGDTLCRQVVGIPMGTDCAPFLANLFLFSYEFNWLNTKLKEKKWDTLNKFKRTCRYIDDLFTINNDKYLKIYQKEIYPPELSLTTDEKTDQMANYLDLHIEIINNNLNYTIYDKRDTFSFPIINFPNLSGNIPTAQSYGVFTAQLVRYARGNKKLCDFKSRTLRLVGKLLTQNGFKLARIKRTYLKFLNTHATLLKKYKNMEKIWDIL